MKTEIMGSEKVISFFGYWPEFCDAKIISFGFDKVNNRRFSIHLAIDYIDSDQKKRAKISILFDKISNLKLNNLFVENVLDNLKISNNHSSSEMPYSIELESCFGINGAFNCESVEVINVEFIEPQTKSKIG